MLRAYALANGREYTVAHKTGDGSPVIANDVGIIYAPSGPIVLSFFSPPIRHRIRSMRIG